VSIKSFILQDVGVSWLWSRLLLKVRHEAATRCFNPTTSCWIRWESDGINKSVLPVEAREHVLARIGVLSMDKPGGLSRCTLQALQVGLGGRGWESLPAETSVWTDSEKLQRYQQRATLSSWFDWQQIWSLFWVYLASLQGLSNAVGNDLYVPIPGDNGGIKF